MIGVAPSYREELRSSPRYDGGNANHWLEILLIGTKSNRDGIGSSLKLTSEGITTSNSPKAA